MQGKIPSHWETVCAVDWVVINGSEVVVAIFRGLWSGQVVATGEGGEPLIVGAAHTRAPLGACILFSLSQLRELATRYRFEQELEPTLEMLTAGEFPETSEHEPEVMSAARWERYEVWRQEGGGGN